MESHHDLISLFEHDLRANAFRVCREGKPLHTFPDHALVSAMVAVDRNAAKSAAYRRMAIVDGLAQVVIALNDKIAD
jgi:hypothetical protein